MNDTLEQRPHYKDEFSIVDLAAIFIRRRRIFYIVFILITLAGLAYALLANETYQYTTLVQVAETRSGEYVEEPVTVIATLQNRWLPEEQTAFRAESDIKLPFEVLFSNPEDTGLIRYVSEATKSNNEIVQQVHQNLVSKVQKRQNALVERERERLLNRIQSTEKAIETLQGGRDAGPALAEAFERKVALEGDLDALASTDILVVSRESADKVGPARALILIIAMILGGVLGVIGVILTEFGISVRAAIQSDF